MYKETDFDGIDLSSPPPETEPERQYYFLAKCSGYTERFYRENGRFPMACVVTFGCPFVRVNKMLTKYGKYRSTEWKEI